MLRRSVRKRKVPIRSGAPVVQPVPLSVSKRKAPIPSCVPAIQPASSSQPLDSNWNVPDDVMTTSANSDAIMTTSANSVSSNTKRSDYLKWEQYFMAMAFISGQRSKDPVCQVGACIVNLDKRIVGLGYNGMPNNCSDDEFPWGKGATTNNKHLYVCCAELNAIVNKIQADIRGSEIYVTRFPCNQCAKIIVQSRLKKVTYYYDKGFTDHKEKASKKILEANKVELIKYEPNGVSLKLGKLEEFML